MAGAEVGASRGTIGVFSLLASCDDPDELEGPVGDDGTRESRFSETSESACALGRGIEEGIVVVALVVADEGGGGKFGIGNSSWAI